MARTSKNFFDDFDELMKQHAEIPNYVPARLVHYNINGRDVGPEDIVSILEGIKQGNRVQMNRWGDLHEYLTRTLHLIEDNKRYENMSNWDQIYGFWRDLGDDEDGHIDVAEIEYRMEIIINRLLHTDFAMNTNQLGNFFGLIKPSEQMALTSLERQGIEKQNRKRMTLPPEMFREIKKFTGKGGRTKLRRNKMRKRKTMQRKKGRKTRKYSKG